MLDRVSATTDQNDAVGPVVQREGESSADFAIRWRNSPAGKEAWAKARAMVPFLAAEHRAEQLRDARTLDRQSNRRSGSINSTIGRS